jgi:hypothetical protein
VAEHVLDEKRHAAEWAATKRLLVETTDAIRIELHHRLDGAVNLALGGDRSLGKLPGAHLLLGH